MDNFQYVDRKMMKWTPFNALLEHSVYISDLLHGRERVDKPILSEDQFYDLNYKLEEAYNFHTEITVKHYDNGYLKEVKGLITRIDVYNKLIFIDEVGLEVTNIMDIY